MQNLDLLKEVAALAGYTITAATGQDVTNKARALRRVNAIKADIVARYGGKWDANYREGWLPIVPLYVTGTAVFTNGSNTVTGVGTAWTSSMKGSKILGPDTAYYKIASVVDVATVILTEPFQGTTNTTTYQIWQDEYVLYPDVLAVGGFIDYFLPQRAVESTQANMKESYPYATTNQEPTVYTRIGNKPYLTGYSTGTVSGTINTNVITGSGTSWLANVKPGYAITVGPYTYHVDRVNSDTEIELHQLLVVGISAGTTYSAIGKNALVIRFRNPTSQRIVHYWYYCKDYPFVNDADEDWVAETYPEVILTGAVRKDYLDKNDVARASLSKQEYEDLIKNMRVATETAFTGVRTVGYYIPPAARE